MDKKSIAIIPARGGSKRIPRKNIKDFFGKPLIAYSIQTAIDSKLFDKVIVTTDDKEIMDIAERYGAQAYKRPEHLADDYTATQPVIDDVLSYLKNNDEEYDYYCTIYATAPLLQAKYLIEGFEKLYKSDAINALSVTSMPFPIQRTFKIDKNERCEMFWPENYNSRSQDLEEAYQDAGQFYWTKLGKESTEVMFGKNSIPIVLPRHLVQDIDTLEDWERAEFMYRALFQDDFDRWNSIKKQLHNKEEIINFYQGNIYFMSIGQNVGYEALGKKALFLRPVLVYKKLSKSTFLGIPLTSKEKEGSYYFAFNYKKGIKSTAMLNQMRVFDIKRSEYLSGKINKNTYINLEKKIYEFMKITPSKSKGNANEG